MLKYIILPIIFILLYMADLWNSISAVSLPALPAHEELLLVPLDSRPVCSTMVQKLGKLAGINVIVPPKELLDNYQEPAKSKKLWQWLQNKSANYNTSIISTDILLHGSLLQTRQHIASAQEQDYFFSELNKLQKNITASPPRQSKYTNSTDSDKHQLQLFSVIPRLLVSDEVYPDCWYQWHLMRYSQLLDMVQINGDYAMTKELMEYKKEIPTDILSKYTSIFTQSQGFNERLLAHLLTKAKSSKNIVNTQVNATVATNAPLFIIGQDDSSPFGLPHMTATKLARHIEEHTWQTQAQLTNGADEIAALLLTRHFLQQSHWQPKLFLAYGSPKTEFKHMPYMASSVGATLRNQAQLVGAQLVEEPNAADIILFVHCGDADAKPTAAEAEQLASYLKHDKHVALIDLSANFEAEEMLLPLLLEQNISVNRLAAYAGWNTFSNSSGTALAQSIIFTGRLRQLQAQQSATDNPLLIPALYADNLNFTIERMLEDYYYQKRIHPQLRPYLESFGTTPTDLEPEEKQQTEYRIQERLSLYATWLYWRSLSRTPFYADTHKAYYLTDLTVGAKLPWNRIFEVDLNVHTKVSSEPAA